jgi:predicted chitinase
VTGRSRWSARWVAVVLVWLLASGGIATDAGAQAPEAVPTPAQPPIDNVFPVPLPHEVSFADTWHACRDGCARRHKGTDIMADEGVPAVAVEPGVIAKVDDAGEGLGGLTVWLRGDSGVAYYYAHNAENLVVVGERVERGQVIARVGNTGNARTTPPHIHFQINLCGELSSAEPCTVNPYPYLQTWSQHLVDGGSDGVGWYEPATATFVQRNDAGSALTSFAFGEAGATDVVPLAGDWNGDGRDTVGLYRRSDATFHLRDGRGEPLEPVAFGEAGRTDVWPIAGDFDGDGRDTVGLYRQGDATFVVLVGDGVESPPVALGEPGRVDALPVVGDWDGSGRDSIGLYHRDDATLILLDDAGEPQEPATVGAPGADAFPVVGDWDGDGHDRVGVLRREAATFDLPVPDLDDPDAVRSIEVPLGEEALGGEPGAGVLPVAGDWNGSDLVTLDDLRQIFGTLPDESTVAEGLPALNAAMARAGISTPARKAAFLATLRNESGFRFDAVESGVEGRYRGRGFIQLTGEHNYRTAGDFFDLDLAGDPDLATDVRVSPVVAVWYWTVARDINRAADRLDMAAVNISVGFAPTAARDAARCDDFVAAFRHFTGGTEPEVNCERTAASRLLALSGFVPFVPAGGEEGAPSGTVAAPG